MNRGITVFVVLMLVVCVAGGIFGLGVMRKNREVANSQFVGSIEELIASYKKANPAAEIEPTNGAWAMALVSGPGGDELSQLLVEGRFVDTWGYPLKFEEVAEGGGIKVTSVGKDGQAGTADDVDGSAYEPLTAGN